jgi:hypothetical protein
VRQTLYASFLHLAAAVPLPGTLTIVSLPRVLSFVVTITGGQQTQRGEVIAQYGHGLPAGRF